MSKTSDQTKRLAPQSSKRPAQIIILGMHRSGTSALTGAIHAMGAFCGDDEALTGKNWENPLGFFERRDTRAICDSILHGSNADWWKVANFDADRVPHSVIRARLTEFQAVIAELDEGAGNGGSWVLKEPRFCVLYPILQRALFNPHVVIVVRHPLEVARSLRHRNGFTLDAGLALWEAYMVSANRGSASSNPLLIGYETLISNPEQTLEKLAGDLAARGVTGLDAKTGAAAILSSLRREAIDNEKTENRLTPAQNELWDIFKANTLPDKSVQLSADAYETLLDFESDETARKSLEAEVRSIRQRLKDTQNLADQLETATTRADALSKEVDIRTAETEVLNAQLAETTQRTQVLANEIEGLRKKLNSESERTDAIAQQSEQYAASLKQVQAQKYTMGEELESARAALAQSNTEAQNLRSQKIILDEKVRAYAAKLAQAQNSFGLLKKEYEENQNSLTAIRRHSDSIEAASAKATSKTIALMHEVDSLTKRLAATQNAREQLHRSLRWRAGGILLMPLAPFRLLQAKLAMRKNQLNKLLIGASDLFDHNKYLAENPDIADSGLDPLDHYLTTGWREEREPSSKFSASRYLAAYPDVAALKTNPLLHYLKHGKAEGRDPNPKLTTSGKPADAEYALVISSGMFDEKFYLATYPDVKQAGVEALEHFLSNGWREGRDPNPNFSCRGYLQMNPDVAAADKNPLVHYLTNGKSEGRATVSRSNFDISALSNNFLSKSLPDLFAFRAAQRTSKRIVVFNATDCEAISEVVKLARGTSLQADIVVLHSNAIKSPEPTTVVGESSSLFTLAYPSTFLSAKALTNLINEGPLTDYEQVLWVRLADRHLVTSAEFKSKISSALKSTAGIRSLSAETFIKFSMEDDLHVRQGISTFFARLGRPRPTEALDLPDGDIICIPSLICNQIKAYPVRAHELGMGPDSERLLLTIIAAIADEADIEKVRLEDASAGHSLMSGDGRTVKAVAFYLPQFHPIEENDRWWGKGFTEWTNVAKAKPLFRSHYQPQLPADLGFYDLRSPQTQLAQANLAHDYGLHGFCYYYYWFDGKKILNEPIEQMVESGSPNFPFCVCWANENWSRNWDGQNRYVLLEQHYSEESNRELIQEFIKLMRDDRYIRHNGKPVLLVYRIRIIPNWLETAKMWRDECRKAGIGEIHLCAVRFGLEPLDGQPAEFGLDSFVLFPPHECEKIDARGSVYDLNPDFNGTILDYDSAMTKDLERFEEGYPWPVHRGVMLGWDNTARRPRDSRIFIGSTPARLHRWLKGIVSQENRHNEDAESLIFVNAWNEWAEGTMLEPSVRFGRGYLDALRAVVGPLAQATERPSPRLTDGTLTVETPMKAIDIKWFEGSKTRNRNVATVLVCAHVVSHQLFGAERSFLDVLDALGKLDINVVVALPTDVHVYYTRLCTERSCGVAIVPYSQWRDNRDPDSSIVKAFATLIADHDVNLVYANTIVLLEPLIAARDAGCPTIIHVRELIDRDEGLVAQLGLEHDAIIERVEELADGIIANSRETERLFGNHNNTFCVPNIVSPEDLDISNQIGESIKFVMASSNIPKKGLDDFIAVARQCEESVPTAEFILVGPENSHTKELRETSPPGNVTFAGYLASPTSAMERGNVVLSLSHFAESFGRTVAEGQMARRPIIAYDWGAVPELIVHGETGFLAPYRDIDAVCGYVKAICENPGLISAFGEAGRAHMLAGFTPPVLTDGLWRALEATAKKPIGIIDACRKVTVVVPVYNAFEATKACLESLKARTDHSADTRILMLNDASTDPRIATLLETFAQLPNFFLHTNAVNKGYTRTINVGINWAERDDVVLLNSDTVVTKGWLKGLKLAAYSGVSVATATAMSDNAGAFSFPVQNSPNPKPENVSFDDFANLIIAHTAKLSPVNVPTGSGFCMYIRRDALNQIGLFDDEAFPRGYGEENDFCMRAIKAGLRNVISPYAYVFHVRSASFGREKEILIKGAVDTVTARYPEYARLVKESFGSEEMQALRQASHHATVQLS